MKKLFILASISLLTSCSLPAFLVTATGNISCEFIFNNYDNVIIHSESQNSYLNDNYQNIHNYAQGNEEKSKPVDFTLEWECNVTNATVDSYYLNVSLEENLTNFKTYITTTESYTFSNLFIGTTYYYSVTANIGNTSFSSRIQSFTTEDKGPRNVDVDGVTNARDLGGYITCEGKRVKQGLIYRMGQLNHSYHLDIDERISLKGKKTLLDDFKVKSEIDLREVSNNESGGLFGSVLGKDINYYPYHMSWDVTNASRNEIDAITKVFKVFTNPDNYPIIFHCAIGTDRTGVIAFYLNALLGLELEDIYRDYLFSNFGDIGGKRNIDNAISHYEYLSTFPGNNLKEKTYNYFLSIGFTNEELDTICQIMLED